MQDNSKKEIKNLIKTIAADLKIDIDVIMSERKTSDIVVQDAKVKSFSLSNTHSMAIRTIKEESVGLSKTTTFTEESIKKTVAKALSLAKLVKKAPYEKLNIDKNNFIKDDREIEVMVTLQEREEQLIKFENELSQKVRDDISFKLASNAHRVREEIYSVFSSDDVSCENTTKYHEHFYKTTMNKEDKYSSDFSYNISRGFKGVNINEDKDKTVSLCQELLDASPIKKKRYDIIFDVDQLRVIFATFYSLFSSKALLEKKNPFADKLNTQVTSLGFNLSQVPTHELCMRSHYFDDEGYMTKPISLIKNGELISFCYNSATANELGVKNNFCAQRSQTGPLDIGVTNILISKGETSEHDIYSGEVFEIISMQGAHSGISFIKGDFSLAATGYLKKNGIIEQYVKGVTIAGNFYEMIKNISAIGDELKVNSTQDFVSPLVRFANINVAGS